MPFQLMLTQEKADEPQWNFDFAAPEESNNHSSGVPYSELLTRLSILLQWG